MNGDSIPTTQHAVELVGQDQLRLNTAKPVPRPGPYQVLVRVEAVGLCFSDMKVLKQFDQHPRKSEVLDGVPREALTNLPSYVPDDKPTVLGHEASVRVVAVGHGVDRYHVGERCLVQADWRHAKTAGSNAAFGYNFEGALQEYVLFDQRVVYNVEDEEDYLVKATDICGASAIALTEPWACVESSYVTPERRHIRSSGKLLIVAEAGHPVDSLDGCFDAAGGRPAEITAIYGTPGQKESFQLDFDADEGIFHEPDPLDAIESLPEETFDDIVYFGARPETIEALNDKLGRGGILNIVLAGESIGRAVNIGVGRIHYGGTRWIGTTSGNAAVSYEMIPETGDIRDGDEVHVVGAGGPMGQMHVIRALCLQRRGLTVTGSDLDEERLASLVAKAEPLAQQNQCSFRVVNSKEQSPGGPFTYHALMAPVPSLLVDAIANSHQRAIVNVFAGIPAAVKHEIDLDTVIDKQIFLFGTSGSTLEDMLLVLEKVEAGTLDTNCSVDAISGLAGAIDGIAAVEQRTYAGKIVVYPGRRELGLVPLRNLPGVLPEVAAKCANGVWTKAAEDELIGSGE